MFSRLNSDDKVLILIIVASLAFKFALFGYGMVNFPSFIWMPDTPTYLDPGINLAEKGVFATFSESGTVKYEILRTPGYPLFLGILNGSLKLSLNEIIVIQILLITLAGYIVYKAACELDKKIALLAAFIFLFDMPVTISSLMLLSEALFTFFMALFMYFFLKYLKGQKTSALVLSAIIIAAATYVRPISYYLGVCVAAGVILSMFRAAPKRALAHGLLFFLIFYALVGAWNYRNYLRVGQADFTTIDNVDLRNMGLLHKYARESAEERAKTGPFLYYTRESARSAVTFLTIPGTLKYLRSVPLKIFSKIYGYPWVVFWLIGLFFARYNKLANIFLLLTILYTMAVSTYGVGLCTGSRFRAPVMPMIAILSAGGWAVIYSKIKPRV